MGNLYPSIEVYPFVKVYPFIKAHQILFIKLCRSLVRPPTEANKLLFIEKPHLLKFITYQSLSLFKVEEVEANLG